MASRNLPSEGAVVRKNEKASGPGLDSNGPDIILSASIPALILVHLIMAPYTKVEESFNIQATHDVLVYGTPSSNIHSRLSHTYDHFTFPGAVPRTFVGSVLLAGISQPIILILGFQHAQIIIRALLGLFNAFSLHIFTRNLRQAYGPAAARWYLLLQASQFHVLFYASRTLPNMFAFGLTTLASSYLLPNPKNIKSTPRRQRLAITMFVFAAVIFRSEVALLLATNLLYLVLLPAISIEQIIFPFAASFAIALASSVPIDSYFWQKPIWPELWGFYYNVVGGNSSNWGTSPWYYYFVSALPRLLVNPLSCTVLIPYSLYHPALAPAAKKLVIPSLLFVAIYSLQPHKEARFIFYVVPSLTAAAALGAATLSRKSQVLTLILFASVLASFAISTGMLLISSLNYPGGEALSYLATSLAESPLTSSGEVVPIHADVLSCMTGVTLFGSSSAAGSAFPKLEPDGGLIFHEKGSRGKGVVIKVDKTEDEGDLVHEEFWRGFRYVLTEDPDKVKERSKGVEWETVGVVRGFGGVEVLKPGQEGQRGNVGEVVGKGRVVEAVRDKVRGLTGGWWVGPRMVDRIWILRRGRGGKAGWKVREESS
ncbi:Dol-P-Man:Man(7)GlcNAc(2)-PP-Dol alpha-1,6-mannosyltransferase [Podospora bellae-mahoneyi]|uniref:Mannosyltransferase n=1 Tax=Podospora bellae-mahoneyi TaxID=2093777 RepID=A0ABR0FYC9_9PEZI|nr:Dol-P-Man:Man(7)GlcNAc(2)-PP-Dol alpha-1,6-mannosyltransferase [Podospora bellae-mahoneyi]